MTAGQGSKFIILGGGSVVLTLAGDLHLNKNSLFGVDNLKMLSDHRNGSFGERYGTLIKDLRIEGRAIFVLDKDDTLRHVEYVKEVADHPNYEAALDAVKKLG